MVLKTSIRRSDLASTPPDVYERYMELREDALQRKRFQRMEMRMSRERVEETVKELFREELDAFRSCYEALKSTRRGKRGTVTVNRLHKQRYGHPIPTEIYHRLTGLGLLQYRTKMGGGRVALTEYGRRVDKYIKEGERRMEQRIKL
jgi:hypothetical protein